MNKNQGFTLIEVLLYTLIFAIVGGLMTGILLTVTQVQQRESASAEVTGQLNFIMQRIQYLVRESSNIEIEAGVTTSTLKLRMKDSTKDPTCLSLVNGVIKLAEGPGTNPNNCTTNTSDLTSDRVTVDKLEFKKFIYYPGHDTLSLEIQMTYNSQNPKSRVQRTLSSAIVRVSAATFDSDLVPGGSPSYNYTIGQSGAPWLKTYIADGTAANPSYTFANNTGLGLFRAGADILGFTTNSTERMRIDASGNVGIGTTSPGATNKLDVAGNIHATSQVRSDYEVISGYVAGGGIGSLTAYSWATGVVPIIAKGFTGQTADLQQWQNSAGTSLVVIDKSGNVGIGTTGPGAKLEVNGTAKATNFSGIANSLVRIQATATVGSTSPGTWIGNASCPAEYTIVFWGTVQSIQFWGGGMTHWYATCAQNGNGIQANLYTQTGYVGHTLTCSGLCAKQ